MVFSYQPMVEIGKGSRLQGDQCQQLGRSIHRIHQRLWQLIVRFVQQMKSTRWLQRESFVEQSFEQKQGN
jgi:hypothetical protein